MVSEEFLGVTEGNGLSIGLATPPPEVLLTPNIGVIGVGGAGGNAVNNMVVSELVGVSFFVANTDAQALSKSLVADRLQLGVALTKGLGAGANPEVGKAAAEETMDKIKEYLKGLHLLFVTAGMGGGTGTGAAPVIARLAKEMNILTVGVVSKPFSFEGKRRMRVAEQGIEELQKYVDSLIVIPNQNLFRIAGDKTTLAEAFKIADTVLCQGVRSITDLVMGPGLINLDFADVRTVLSDMGRSMMGTGESSGENRAAEAAERAISNPLLDNSTIKGAKSILINVSGGSDLTLSEVDTATERIVSELDQDANIIFGATMNEELQGKIRVSLVATGMQGNDPKENAHVTNSVGSSSRNMTPTPVEVCPSTVIQNDRCGVVHNFGDSASSETISGRNRPSVTSDPVHSILAQKNVSQMEQKQSGYNPSSMGNNSAMSYGNVNRNISHDSSRLTDSDKGKEPFAGNFAVQNEMPSGTNPGMSAIDHANLSVNNPVNYNVKNVAPHRMASAEGRSSSFPDKNISSPRNMTTTEGDQLSLIKMPPAMTNDLSLIPPESILNRQTENLVTEITEPPVLPDPALFDERAPSMAKVMPVSDIPEIRPDMPMGNSHSVENVKPVRSASRFPFSGLFGKKHQSSKASPKKEDKEISLFDSDDNIDLPAFLRRSQD